MVTFDSNNPYNDYHVEVVVQGETRHYDVRGISAVEVENDFSRVFQAYGPIITKVILTSKMRPSR